MTMIPYNDVRPLIETAEYAVWIIDNFDMGTVETQCAIPAVNRLNGGKVFSYASVTGYTISGTQTTGVLAVMVSNEVQPHNGIPSVLVAHPDAISKTGIGSGWASADFALGHYYLGFKPTTAQTGVVRLFVMMKA